MLEHALVRNSKGVAVPSKMELTPSYGGMCALRCDVAV